MVHTNSYSGAMLLAKSKKFGKLILNSLKCIGKVARIYSYLFYMKSRFFSRSRIEMHVCHKRSVITLFTKHFFHFCSIGSLFHTLCGKTNDFATHSNKSLRLSHTRFGVCGKCVQHRLHTYRIFSTYTHLSYLNCRTYSSFIVYHKEILSG